MNAADDMLLICRSCLEILLQIKPFIFQTFAQTFMSHWRRNSKWPRNIDITHTIIAYIVVPLIRKNRMRGIFAICKERSTIENWRQLFRKHSVLNHPVIELISGNIFHKLIICFRHRIASSVHSTSALLSAGICY